MQNIEKQGFKEKELTFFWGQNRVKLGSKQEGGQVSPYKVMGSRLMSRGTRNWIKSSYKAADYAKIAKAVLLIVVLPPAVIAAIIALVRFLFRTISQAIANVGALLVAYDVPFYLGLVLAAGLFFYILGTVFSWHKKKSPDYEYWREPKPRKQQQNPNVTIIHNYNFNPNEKQN